MQFVLQGVEPNITGLQHMSLQRAKSILSCRLHHWCVVKELDLLVENLEINKVTTDTTISWNHELEGRRILPQVAVVLVDQGKQVFAVGTNNSFLPRHVVKLDHSFTAVQNQSKSFHDGASKKHRCLTRQQVHLHIAMLTTSAEWKTYCPGASQTGITTEEKGSIAAHELDLVDVVASLLELEDVAHERSVACKEG